MIMTLVFGHQCVYAFPSPPPKDHFEQSQFEEIARSPAGGKKLKPNAIPTLFNVGDPPYPAVTTSYILLPLKHEPGNSMLNIFFYITLSK